MRQKLMFLFVFLLAFTLWSGVVKAQPFAYITNHDDDSVSIINTATDVNQFTVNVCGSPNGVAATPDGSAIYVACDPSFQPGFVSRIDPNNLFSVDTIVVGDELEAIAVSPDGSRIYATNSLGGANDEVSVIDGVSFTPITQIDVNRSFINFTGIVVSPDGTRVYATGRDDNGGEEDAVVVIDTSTNTQIDTINLGSDNVQPNGIAISPDGRFVYTANEPIFANGFVSIIDTQNGNSITTVGLGNRDPLGIAVSPDGNTLYVTSDGNFFGGATNDTVSVIELDNGNMVTHINLGSRGIDPVGVDITPNGLKVYVANSDDEDVSLFNAMNNMFVQNIDVGDDPRAFGIFIPSDMIVFDNDLAVVKSGFPNPVNVSDTLIYSVFAINFGNVNATNVMLVDTLPTDVMFDSASAGCSENAGIVTCDLGTMAPGDIQEITIEVTAPADPGAILNVAEVFYDQEANEGTPLDNRTEVITDVIMPPPPPSESDLVITKAGPEIIFPDEEFNYLIEVTNLGPMTAQSVRVRDIIPENMTFELPLPMGCVDNDPDFPGELVCDLGDMEMGDTISFFITATYSGPVGFPEPVLVNNLANVFFGEVEDVTQIDPETSNNTSTFVTRAFPVPPNINLINLFVVKTDTPDPVVVGEDLTYNIYVYNYGINPAVDVIVTDTLPSSVGTDEIEMPDFCDLSDDVIVCNLPDPIGPGGDVVIIPITVTAPEEPGMILNAVNAVANPLATLPDAIQLDFAPSDNSDSEKTTIVPEPPPMSDLLITKSDTPDPVIEGEFLTYTLFAKNIGPQRARGVIIDDWLPLEGIDLTPENIMITATENVTECILNPGMADRPNAIRCLIDVLSVEESATITIKVQTLPLPEGFEFLSIFNLAKIFSRGFPNAGIPASADKNPFNNVVLESTLIGEFVPTADLFVIKSDSPDPVVQGSLLTYVLFASNAGPDPATNVVITDTLPGNVDFISAVPQQGACGHANGTVTCNLGTLEVGAFTQVTVQVTPTVPGTILNVAQISADEHDPLSSNNISPQTTTVLPTPIDPPNPGEPVGNDLFVQKFVSPNPATVGEDILFTILIGNTGAFGSGATLVDALPNGLNFVSASTSTGDACAFVSGEVRCDIANIPSIGQGETVTVSVIVTANIPGTFPNLAFLDDVQNDPNPLNNVAIAAVEVREDNGGGQPPTPTPTDPPDQGGGDPPTNNDGGDSNNSNCNSSLAGVPMNASTGFNFGLLLLPLLVFGVRCIIRKK